MRKLILLLLVCCFCFISSFAVADMDDHDLLVYNACASTFGAPQLADPVKSTNDMILFDVNSMVVGFELSPISGIRSGFIYANNDECSADFLSTGMAMISFLGETDITAFGMLLTQFCEIRAGKTTIEYSIGNDGFGVTTSDDAKYIFIYINSDGKNR